MANRSGLASDSRAARAEPLITSARTIGLELRAHQSRILFPDQTAFRPAGDGIPKRATTLSLAGAALDRSGSVPLYRQIYDELRTAILSGRMAGGGRLPSTRSLAADLGVARLTVLEAFQQLYADGYVEGRSGSGTYVVRELPGGVLRAPVGSPRPAGQLLSRRGATLAGRPMPIPTLTEVRPFVPGIPALDDFPFELWRRQIARQWRHRPVDRMLYGDPAGYPPLREAIATYLGATRGMHCRPEQVVVVACSQQALDLAARLLVDQGDAVWMEDPGYPGARAAFMAAGARVIPIPVDDEGLDVSQAVALAKDARLVYVTPSHQFPLGVTMSLTRRLILLEHAAHHGLWVLEDDYDSEYRYIGRPLTALHGLDHAGRVIYVGSLSKVLFPAVRIGYLVLPPDLVEPFVTARALALGHGSLVEQAVVAEFMEAGHFARHVRRMRALYAERQAALVETARSHLAGRFEVQPTETGIHLVGWLSAGSDDRLIAQRAAVAGITVRAVSSFRMGTAGRPGLVLGFAAVRPPEIRQAMRRLAAILLSAPEPSRPSA